jgi:hypothetical protein
MPPIPQPPPLVPGQGPKKEAKQRTEPVELGVQVGKYTSIRTTQLTPKVPVLGIPVGPPAPVAPVTPGARSPRVNMPTFGTRVVIEETPVKRPVQLTETEGQTMAPILGANETIIAVLNEIDPTLLISTRTSDKKPGYNRNELHSFVTRLGVTAAGKRKHELIEIIENMRRERGMV